MGTYFLTMTFVEYCYLQYLYSKIKSPLNKARLVDPIKSLVFGFLSKLDIYTDVLMIFQIFKWKDEFITSTYFYDLFLTTFVIFWVSLLLQVWTFIRMLLKIQQKSTINPLYSNTTALAYWASFKGIAVFWNKFSVNYYGVISDKFSALKALAFMKLIFEDCIQCAIQTIFYIIINKKNLEYQILISMSLSGLSALTSIAVIFSDSTSPINKNESKFIEA